MNLFQKCIQGSVSLALFVTMAVPFQAQAVSSCGDCQVVCPQENVCEPCFQSPCMPERSCGFSGGYALGAIALGAGAGALAGWAAGSNNRHHRHSNCSNQICHNVPAVIVDGHSSADCDCHHHDCNDWHHDDDCTCSHNCGCTKVDGSVLFFEANFNATISTTLTGATTATGSYSLQFFVTTPNGCTIYGTQITNPFSLIGTGTTTIIIDVLGNMAVCDACCGVYQAGVNLEIGVTQISATAAFTDLTVREGTEISVVSNCPQASETFLPALSVNSVDLSDLVSGSVFSSQYQYSPYTFSPDCCIDKPSCKCVGDCCN